ncbi:MAG: hypothetical protein ACE14P_09300 [Methanotrichaceae archaeon]
MENYEATFAIELDGERPLRFDDLGQIKQIRERLKPENIIEGDADLSGEFQGTIPARRLFQFLRENPLEIIIGKIGQEIEDPSKINHLIGKPMKIKVHTI